MKRLLLGIAALTLVASFAFAINGGGGKKKAAKKAKTECTRTCTEKKDCPKTAHCPNRPDCVCN